MGELALSEAEGSLSRGAITISRTYANCVSPYFLSKLAFCPIYSPTF